MSRRLTACLLAATLVFAGCVEAQPSEAPPTTPRSLQTAELAITGTPASTSAFPLTAQPASPTPLPNSRAVILYDEWPEAGFPVDPATIENVTLQNDTLTIEVTYRGGCEDHEFEMYAATAFRQSLPPEAILHLAHDAKGDTCETLIDDTLVVDLSPLEQERNHPTETPLKLALYEPQGGAFAAEPFQPLPLWE